MVEGIAAVATGVGLLLGFMAVGLPVFAAFLLVNLLAVAVIMGPMGYGMFVNSLYETTTTQSLVTIPLFILMGEILFRSNSVEVLLRSIDTLVGRVKGRQYVLSILLATVFSTLSGAAMGVAAMLGRSLLPGMVARGYDARLSAGTILAGASLAPLIPPSVLVIIIGTLAGVSIAGLLIAGIIPGLMFAAIFLGYCFIRVWLNPSLAPDEPDDGTRATLADKGWALLRVVPFSIIILMVMGLILVGIATPTEAGAMGVIGSLIIAAIYRNLSFKMIGESLVSSAKVAAMILFIMASSKLFSQLLAFTGGASAMTEWVVGLEQSRWVMLILLMLLPFVLCMFIDQIALMLIVIPIYLPIIEELQFDPIWFWLLFLVNITVGGMTPPFGYTLFALKSAWEDASLGKVFSSAWPFVLLYLLGMIVLALVPGLSTLLPSML
ncbi:MULTISPECIES: TRAP transporter large permease [Alphaproteobacteria]|jgi:tripartite ATP-independent transporter DctM subunit|uniref:TRAP transporter large permease protein n=1 Tax=Martelella mediterranea DSM 17316 TaxID=1122214 RepID=A0A1U9Z9Z8_9HYPH|nr:MULTISPECIES: TRAP transporter large permease [Alphaproteobacteria]AQZ54392.1 Neu5Ac permease [Martelella mediterranea DSM 17316]